MSKKDDWVQEPGDFEILSIARDIERREKRPALENSKRVQQMMATKEVLDKMIGGNGVEIKSKPHNPYPSVGYISVSGRKIEIADTRAFLEATAASSMLDICPKVNGTVEMTLTYHGLTV